MRIIAATNAYLSDFIDVFKIATKELGRLTTQHSCFAAAQTSRTMTTAH